MVQDYYRILEVDYDATDESIRSNYIRLALVSVNLRRLILNLSRFVLNYICLVLVSVNLRCLRLSLSRFVLNCVCLVLVSVSFCGLVVALLHLYGPHFTQCRSYNLETLVLI